MSMPGFIQTHPDVSATDRLRAGMPAPLRDRGEGHDVTPAACVWYDYFYAPVACGWVAFNERYGITGYGPSPCAAWQIPSDPVGCAALPRSRNMF